MNPLNKMLRTDRRIYFKCIACLAALLTAAVLVIGCKGEEVKLMANNGDTVRVHYTGTLSDGNVFDSSLEREPMEFTIGEGKVIPGFESAVNGMKVGETKTVTIPPDQAYGQRDENRLIEIDKAQLPPDLNPEIGQQLQMRQADGQTMIVSVNDVSDKGITVDANHPLAGKDLTFKIELVEIK